MILPGPLLSDSLKISIAWRLVNSKIGKVGQAGGSEANGRRGSGGGGGGAGGGSNGHGSAHGAAVVAAPVERARDPDGHPAARPAVAGGDRPAHGDQRPHGHAGGVGP